MHPISKNGTFKYQSNVVCFVVPADVHKRLYKYGVTKENAKH